MSQQDDLIIKTLGRLEEKVDAIRDNQIQHTAKQEELEARTYKCEERLEPLEDRVAQARGAIGLLALFGAGYLLTWLVSLFT